MRILIIEDEVKLANAVKQGLAQDGFAVDTCHDGKAGLAQAQAIEYDALVVDWMLPEMDGLEVVRNLRNEGNITPILMLTAKDSVTDKVTGLNSGADDYLPKPFSFDELIARIRSLLRRPPMTAGTVLSYNDLLYDPTTHVCTRSGTEVELSAKEAAIIEYLLRNPEQTVSKDAIIEHAWDFNADILPNTVEAHIKQLRQKIEKPFSKQPTLIQTVHGLGYRLEEKDVS